MAPRRDNLVEGLRSAIDGVLALDPEVLLKGETLIALIYAVSRLRVALNGAPGAVDARAACAEAVDKLAAERASEPTPRHRTGRSS